MRSTTRRSGARWQELTLGSRGWRDSDARTRRNSSRKRSARCVTESCDCRSKLPSSNEERRRRVLLRLKKRMRRRKRLILFSRAWRPLKTPLVRLRTKKKKKKREKHGMSKTQRRLRQNRERTRRTTTLIIAFRWNRRNPPLLVILRAAYRGRVPIRSKRRRTKTKTH